MYQWATGWKYTFKHAFKRPCAPSNSFKPLNLLPLIESWFLLTSFNSYPKDRSVLPYQKIHDINIKLPFFFALSQHKGCLDSHHKWRIHKISTREKGYILLRFAIAHRLWNFWRRLQIYLPPYFLHMNF